MEVTLKLKSWNLRVDEKSKQTLIAGKYVLTANGKHLASEDFNDSYGNNKLAFSPDLMKDIASLETRIGDELESAFK